MKAYRIELLVVDHDNVGDDMVTTIEEARYPNRCINPQVMSIEARDIGEWDDDHPLNHGGKAPDEFKRLFSAAAPTPPQEVAGLTDDQAAALDEAFARMRKQRDDLKQRLFEALETDPVLKAGV